MKNDSEISKNILETAPKIMRFIRGEMRKQAKGELTVPQFRILMKLVREPGCTHQEVAEWMGIAAPTLTRMIDTLVKRKLTVRIKDSQDRRKTTLKATALGEKLHHQFQEEVQKQIVGKIHSLNCKEKEKISDALRLLKPLFAE